MSASRTKEGNQQPKELYTAQSMPQPHSTFNNYSNISHQLNTKPNTVLGLSGQHQESNGILTKNLMMDEMYQNGRILNHIFHLVFTYYFYDYDYDLLKVYLNSQRNNNNMWARASQLSNQTNSSIQANLSPVC